MMKNKTKFNPLDLYNRIDNRRINVLDLGETVYITGKVSFPELASCLQVCLNFGIVEVEIGVERK